MFTGIVEQVGRVRLREPSRLVFQAPRGLEDTRVGDSIAVNGACLTVTSLDGDCFSVDVTPETLRRTNLGLLREGDPVNLERSLALGGRMGGHIVQGHVDDTGEVVSIAPEGDSLLMRFEASPHIMRYVVEKGFIAVDGTSLTVVSRDASSFVVSLIPFTRDNTVLGSRKPHDAVNLEIDIIAKYVEQLAGATRPAVEIVDEL